MGFVLAASGAGGMVFMPLVSVWIQNYGYPKAYLISGVIIGIAMVIISVFIYAQPQNKGMTAYGFEGNIS